MPDFINFIFYHTPVFYLIQSVWRDEAFSFFMASPNVFQVILNTARDFNPPFYYLLLHFWMKIVGQSDELLRVLSLMAHLGSVLVAFIFAEKVLSKKPALPAGRFAPWFVAVFVFLNPMLLYYAFEMRMYSFYALLTFATVYFFYFKKWKLYTVSAVLGLYSHSFFPLVLASFAVYLLFIRQFNKKNLVLTLKPAIFFLPWIPVLALQFFNSQNSWLYPVDLQLVTSVLGNLFTNYEGTPGNLWGYNTLLSVVILIFMIITLKKRRKDGLFFSIPVFFPLLLILGYSVLKRPLFVNRYMIFITVFEILAISWAVFSIKNSGLRYFVICFWVLLMLGINIYTAPYRKKTDFKSTFREINKIANPSDFAYAQTPIGFLETAYYFKNKNNVFIYNPQGITIPNYIGVTVVFSDISRSMLPPAPSRTFMIADDASYNLAINKP